MVDLLEPYFQRIGYAGARDATLATLDGIIAAHTRTIPFENLDVLLGRPIALDLPSVIDKLVHRRRGGYCFEHNGLLLAVLEALGFAVQPLSARVRLQRPRDFIPPRTHMFVRVELDGHPWLADVGVGGLSPTCALRLDVEDEQATPHEPRRIVREGGVWFHQARLGDAWADVCEFTLETMPPIDREVANWFTSAHPQSHFKNRLMAARADVDGVRHTLLNHELTVRAGDGSAQHRRIDTPGELLVVLDEVFALRLPAGTRFACEGLSWPSASGGAPG
jgi:N-hydroxyarylamine O-acetyltransferase